MKSTKKRNLTIALRQDSGRKGRRTRDRIKHGFIRALDSKSHLKITIGDICQSANITVGGFYFHFKNQQQLLDEVVTHYIEVLVGQLDRAIVDDDLDRTVEQIINTFLSSYLDQKGLTRCFQQLVRTQTGFAHIWQKRSLSCTERLSKVIQCAHTGISLEKSMFLAISVVNIATTAFNVHYFLRERPPINSDAFHTNVAATVIAMCHRMVAGGAS